MLLARWSSEPGVATRDALSWMTMACQRPGWIGVCTARRTDSTSVALAVANMGCTARVLGLSLRFLALPSHKPPATRVMAMMKVAQTARTRFGSCGGFLARERVGAGRELREGLGMGSRQRIRTLRGAEVRR